MKVLEPSGAQSGKPAGSTRTLGLVDYVGSRNIVVAWRDLKDLLRDQQRDQELEEHNKERGYDDRSPVVMAINEVFNAADEGGFLTDVESMARLRARAGLAEEKRSPPAYIDRHGMLHITIDEALETARAFCRSEPAAVLVNIDVQKATGIVGLVRARNHLLSMLNEYRATWALVRQ